MGMAFKPESILNAVDMENGKLTKNESVIMKKMLRGFKWITGLLAVGQANASFVNYERAQALSGAGKLFESQLVQMDSAINIGFTALSSAGFIGAATLERKIRKTDEWVPGAQHRSNGVSPRQAMARRSLACLLGGVGAMNYIFFQQAHQYYEVATKYHLEAGQYVAPMIDNGATALVTFATAGYLLVENHTPEITNWYSKIMQNPKK